MSTRPATLAVAAVGIAIAAGVGFILQKEVRQRNEQRAAVKVVSEATTQVKSGLKTVSPEALQKLEESISEAKEWTNPELSDATEQYLIGIREIMRRRIEANRLTQKAAASRAALSAHMARAGGRDLGWIRSASALKKQVERDHFDLNVQLNALAELLDTLPEANKRLAPHVEATLLFDDTARRSAHAAVLDEAKRAQAALHKARALVP